MFYQIEFYGIYNSSIRTIDYARESNNLHAFN